MWLNQNTLKTQFCGSSLCGFPVFLAIQTIIILSLSLSLSLSMNEWNTMTTNKETSIVVVPSQPGLECCMCGDYGLSHELFQCKVCHFRSQHRYVYIPRTQFYDSILVFSLWILNIYIYIFFCICDLSYLIVISQFKSLITSGIVAISTQRLSLTRFAIGV